MRRNFILFTTVTILSIVAYSHTAIASPHIASSEVVKPYCDASCIDAIPFQSCVPSELMRDAHYCMAITIPKNTKNMYCAGRASTDSSPVGSPKLDGLVVLALFMFMAAFFSFGWKHSRVEYLQSQLKPGGPMNTDIESGMLLKPIDLKKGTHAEILLAVRGSISYRRVGPDISLDSYLLKEAFEEIERHPKILENPYFYEFVTTFMLETVHRAAFMRIPNDRKVEWLWNRHVFNVFKGWRWKMILP